MAQDNRLLPVSALDRSIDRPLADFAQAKGYGTAGLEPTTFRDYLFVVLKRKWLILSLVLVVTSLVTIQAFRAPSIYEGETTIRIEQKAPNVLQTKEIVIAGQNDPNFWGTQLKLLENPALARQVVLTLDLQHNPSFFGGQSQGGFFSSLRRIVAKPKKVNESPAVSPGLTVVGESEVTGGSLTSVTRNVTVALAVLKSDAVNTFPNACRASAGPNFCFTCSRHAYCTVTYSASPVASSCSSPLVV